MMNALLLSSLCGTDWHFWVSSSCPSSWCRSSELVLALCVMCAGSPDQVVCHSRNLWDSFFQLGSHEWFFCRRRDVQCFQSPHALRFLFQSLVFLQRLRFLSVESLVVSLPSRSPRWRSAQIQRFRTSRGTRHLYGEKK